MAWKQALKAWRILVFFFVPIILLPFPLVIGTQLAGTAYVLIVSVIFFITMPVPLCISTLLPIVLYPLLGVHSTKQVATWCINDPTILFLGNMIFGMAIEGANLHIRIALKTLLLLGPKPERLLLACLIVSFVLSMWIANIGVVVMLMPIIFAIKKELLATELVSETTIEDNTPPSENLPSKVVPKITAGMTFAVVYGATMGGMTTLVGSHPSIMFKLVTDQLYGDAAGVNFATHMSVCLPLAISAAIFTWLFMTLIYAPGYISQLWKKRVVSSQQVKFEDKLTKTFQEQYKNLGAMSFGEVSVIFFFFAMVLLWFFRSPPIKSLTGWAVLFKKGYASDGTVAMAVGITMFIWPTDIKLLWKEGKNIPLIQWHPHMTERFPWELIFFAMGSNVLADGTEAGGLAKWVAASMQPLTIIPPWAMMIIISVVLSIITEFIGNSIIVVIVLPILGQFAEDSRVNPIYYMLPATMCAMLSFMTPVSSNLTAFVHGTGAATARQMAFTGIIPKIVCLVLIIVFVNSLGDVIFDVHNFPEWAANRTTVSTLH